MREDVRLMTDKRWSRKVDAAVVLLVLLPPSSAVVETQPRFLLLSSDEGTEGGERMPVLLGRLFSSLVSSR